MDFSDETSEQSGLDDISSEASNDQSGDEDKIGGFVFNNELESRGSSSTEHLAELEQKRLVDLVRLQPTKNAELKEQWGLDSGSDVHQYLESELEKFYYRDDDGYIQATDVAEEFVQNQQDVYPDVTQPEEQSMEDGPDLERRDLVIALVTLTQELGHLPSAQEINEYGEYSDGRYREEFGDLFNAFQAAGLVPDDVSRSDFYSEEDSVSESGTGSGTEADHGSESKPRSVEEGHVESPENENATDEDESTAYSEEIDVSALDVDRPSYEIPEEIDESDLISEIQRFAEILGEPPTEELVASYGRYPGEEYRDRFESWEDALVTAGYDPGDLPDWCRRTFTNVEVLDVIRAVADELGRPPTTIETGERAPFSQGLGSTRFGGWATALELAGLDPSGRPSVDDGDEDDEAEDDEGDPIGSVIDDTLEEMLLSEDDGPF